MKIEFVQTKHLGVLKTADFMCKGCGMVPASDECPVCSKLWRSEKNRAERRNLYAIGGTLLGLCLMAIYAIVKMFGR